MLSLSLLVCAKKWEIVPLILDARLVFALLEEDRCLLLCMFAFSATYMACCAGVGKRGQHIEGERKEKMETERSRDCLEGEALSQENAGKRDANGD